MTMLCYTGIPGSGKTYHAVMDMCHQNGAIITNVHVSDIDDCAVMTLNDITPEMLMSFSGWWFQNHEYKENSLLLVLDEAQLLFNSRNWNDSARLGWVAFMSQHRKYGYRIILIAQDIKMIDKQFRSLVEFEVHHTAASSVFFPMRLLAMFGFHFTCANTRYPQDDTHSVIRRDMFHVSSRYYRHYDSNEDLTARDYSDVDISALTSQFYRSEINPSQIKSERSLLGSKFGKVGKSAREKLACLAFKSR